MTRFDWSPTGDRLLYHRDARLGGPADFYVVDVAGAEPGPPMRVNGPLVQLEGGGSGRASGAVWSPDGSKIAYIADQDVWGDVELFVVDVSGAEPSAPVQLNGELPLEKDVGDFEWSPDGRRLVYRSNESGRSSLWLVDLSGATPSVPQEVSTLPTGGVSVDDPTFVGYGWSPDGRRLFYGADHAIQNVVELYFVDFSSGSPTQPVRLNTPLPDGSKVGEALWSADSSRLAYRAGRPTDTLQLFLIDFSSGAPSLPISLDSGIYPGTIHIPPIVIWSPDSSRLAFHASPAERTYDLFTVDVSDLGAVQAIKLNSPVVGDVRPSEITGACDSVRWSPDSSRLVYDADGLWMVDFSSGAPSAPVRVNSELEPPMGVFPCPFLWSTDGTGLLFERHAGNVGMPELQHVQVTTPGVPERVNAELGVEGSFAEYVPRRAPRFSWSPDGARIGYLADEEVTDLFSRVELYIVSVSALGTATKISVSELPQGDVVEFEWAPIR